MLTKEDKSRSHNVLNHSGPNPLEMRHFQKQYLGKWQRNKITLKHGGEKGVAP